MSNYQLTAADAANLANNISGSKSFGPLTINYDLDLSIPQLTVNASIYGTSIGHVVINKDNPSATLGGSVGIAKAEVGLTANFDAQELDYSVDVEVLGSTVYKGSGKLFSW